MKLGYFPLLPYSHAIFIAKKQDDFLPSSHSNTCTSVVIRDKLPPIIFTKLSKSFVSNAEERYSKL